MAVMRRLPLLATAGAICAGVVVPALAFATQAQIGQAGPDAAPACPKTPCLVVSRTTGYQAKVGTTRGLMTIPQDGRIVAWKIALGKPGTKQIAFFDSKLGGEATAQITIIRPGRKLRSRVMAQGEPQKLSPYFGTTVEFPLEKTIAVKKGWIVALTVPTWAPALADGLGPDTSWRAARGKGNCEDTQAQTAQTQALQLAQYYCLYKARLTYSATLVSTP
jgi:hypothetical protein